jgi:hypothetical protein
MLKQAAAPAPNLAHSLGSTMISNFAEIFVEFHSERFCGGAAATVTRIL